MRKRLVVANWKMNLNLKESLNLVDELDKKVSTSPKLEVVICPSAVWLEPLKHRLKPVKFQLGAQNIHWEDHGPFTGEVAAAQVSGVVKYVIVGHSERRLHFGETNDMIARKVSAVVRNGMTPILCVGEDLIDRQDGHMNRVLHDQLNTGLIMLTTREVARVVVAYEPIWAIGTGEIAKPEQLKAAVKVIRNTIKELYGDVTSETARLLYGGSVEADFVADYLKLPGIDGFLVGGASLNAHSFASIIKSAQQGTAPRGKVLSKEKA